MGKVGERRKIDRLAKTHTVTTTNSRILVHPGAREAFVLQLSSVDFIEDLHEDENDEDASVVASWREGTWPFTPHLSSTLRNDVPLARLLAPVRERSVTLAPRAFDEE